MYKPSEPFTVPMFLLIPTEITAKGSTKTVYPTAGELIYCRFRTFGGTEKVVDGVLSVEDTAIIETWYRPDIKANCRLADTDGMHYEILGTPEDINKRHQSLRFKIRTIKGGA